MKNLWTLKKLMLLSGVFFLVICFIGCSSSDELDDPDVSPNFNPTGSIDTEGQQWLYENSLLVDVTAGQLSWLAAVEKGNEITNDFIAKPIRVIQGSTSVVLTFNENVIPDDQIGKEVVLKLYADNPKDGLKGQWDDSDIPIMDTNGQILTKTFFVINYSDFAFFDLNDDGLLDFQEALPSYIATNYFRTWWDSDGNGSLDKEEFYNAFFYNSDYNSDNFLDENEWNLGFMALFIDWTENNFTDFDEDENQRLSPEEWTNIFGDSQWFETYDTDGNTIVTENEWNLGLFGNWDQNTDNLIDEDEFERYYFYILSWIRW